jgi:hypothetical protein
MNTVEEDIAERLGNEIAQAIDFEIMCTLLAASGWTSCMSSKLKHDPAEFDSWLASLAPRKFLRHHEQIIFQEKEDALMYSLRWP